MCSEATNYCLQVYFSQLIQFIRVCPPLFCLPERALSKFSSESHMPSHATTADKKTLVLLLLSTRRTVK